jgi:hypothetical protein
VAVGLCCSACVGTSAAPPANAPVASAQKLTTAQRFHVAKPIAVNYVKALARGDRSGAQIDVGNSGYRELSSLTRLETWFSLIPAKKLRVTATPQAVSDPSAVGVRLVMSARLGPAPLTTWVPLGERVLLVQDQQVGWRVLADVTTRAKMHAHVYGLSLMVQPHFLTNKHLTVIYGPDQAQLPARTIFGTGSSVVKMLHNKYGGGVAGRHMVMYLVEGLSQGEKLTGVKIGRKETPAGWQYKDFAYIDYPAWEDDEVIEQNSTVAHELTHVASHTMLRGAPHSLIEGVAMYEEERFLNHLGFQRRFDLINAYYQAGSFPSAQIWGVQWADWGLKNATAVEACYQDGEAMSAVIIEQHGGVPALARLAKAFRSFHHIRYSAAQVDAAFQHALGVSFDTVVGEAHAYAGSH